jgi:hypothetical protein
LGGAAEHRGVEHSADHNAPGGELETVADRAPGSPALLADLERGTEVIRRRRAPATVSAHDSDLAVLRAYLRQRNAPDPRFR